MRPETISDKTIEVSCNALNENNEIYFKNCGLISVLTGLESSGEAFRPLRMIFEGQVTFWGGEMTSDGVIQ